MSLRQLVQTKTGYIPDELYKEALSKAKNDVRTHSLDFEKKSKAEKLQYIADVMAIYVIMERRYKHEKT